MATNCKIERNGKVVSVEGTTMLIENVTDADVSRVIALLFDVPVAAPATPPAPPVAASEPPAKRSYKRRKSSKPTTPHYDGEPASVPLSECVGVGKYRTAKGDSCVAVWKKDGDRWVLLWVDKTNETASHNTGGFKVLTTTDKLFDVTWFDEP